MYPIFVYTSIIFYEFIDISKTKYDGALHTLQAFEKKEINGRDRATHGTQVDQIQTDVAILSDPN